MQKMQLSVKGQIGLVLVVVMFFSVAITIAGFAGSGQERDKIAAFASDSAVTTGTIADKYIHIVSKVWVYWVDVRFKLQNGSTRTDSTIVANTLYDRLSVGDPIQVTYVRSDPQWFYVAGSGAPTQRDVDLSTTMCEVGITAILLSLVGFLGLFLWNNDSGSTPVARTDTGTSRTQPTSPVTPARPRATFGTRRT